MIDRLSPLDPASTEREKLESAQGNVELKNLQHIYPSQPKVVVIENVDLMKPACKTIALVGALNSGESTIVRLLERFYDPVSASVYINGHDIKGLIDVGCGNE